MAWLSRLRFSSAVPMLKPSRKSIRSYASAAAVELDYESDDDEYYGYFYGEDNRPRREPEPRLGLAGSEPGRGVQWVVMGEPGKRRHLYAEGLSKLLEVPHISMGTLVRQEMNPTSSLYKQIASAINERKLVPEDVIFALLSKRLEEGYHRGETGFILDGIPRTPIQAEILDQIADIDLVVNLKCMEEHLVRSPRTKDSPCQEFLSSGLSSALTSSAWKENLRAYAEQVKPLEEYYRKQRKLLDFQVGGAPREAWQGLLAALHLQHKNARSSSQKVSV